MIALSTLFPAGSIFRSVLSYVYVVSSGRYKQPIPESYRQAIGNLHGDSCSALNCKPPSGLLG